ncbi:MAG: EF-hand domain-containing protein [Parvularcula sp.]|jgi:hypothetical protein|nr:EF-hand domain-containing protein [Parvularcula sp.]
MKHIGLTTMASVAMLSLAACDSENVENTPVDDIDEIVDEDEPYPVGGTLNEQQQSNYDAMDRQSVSDEYDANRQTMIAQDGTSDGASASGMDDAGGQGSMGTEQSGSSDSSMAGASMSSMPARSAMTFDYLDRNGDGQLSVAEYAIWALPTNPNPPEPNDAIGPHLTTEEINTAGQTFFYFDDDGDSYLSMQEFQDARNSGRTA